MSLRPNWTVRGAALINRIGAFATDNARIAWIAFLAASATCVLLAAFLARDLAESERLTLLQTEATRRGIDIMSQTLNGNVMGSLLLLGVVDADVKQDSMAMNPPNGIRISNLLENVAHASEADGVFIVGSDGVVRSSWDSTGRPSTGLNVGFRPYFQIAMKGQENVYAAVSLARGDRALYFTAPVRVSSDRRVSPTVAVVARTALDRVDRLLREPGVTALLLSPQGVVFAASRPDWEGFLAGEPTLERLTAIRELKQFGDMFEGREPRSQPFLVEPGQQMVDGQPHALAIASVKWNDPSGDWTLLLMEDLSRSVPARIPLTAGLITGVVMLVIGTLVLAMLRGHHGQVLASRRIEA